MKLMLALENAMECLMLEGPYAYLDRTIIFKVATWGVYQFGKHRKQFGIPLIKMEGVNGKWLDMLYQTWVIQSSVNQRFVRTG